MSVFGLAEEAIDPVRKYLALVGLLLLVALLAFTHLTVYRWGRQSVQREWDKEKLVQRAAADALRANNLELQQAAEKKYVVQGATVDRYVVQTIKEIQHESASAPSCPVPPAVRVRLNALAACYRNGADAACGGGGSVPGAGGSAGPRHEQ